MVATEGKWVHDSLSTLRQATISTVLPSMSAKLVPRAWPFPGRSAQLVIGMSASWREELRDLVDAAQLSHVLANDGPPPYELDLERLATSGMT